MSETASQNEKILKHLLAGKTLTGMQAVKQFGVMSYTRRIAELRKAGYPVRTELVSRNGKTFGRYSLEGR